MKTTVVGSGVVGMATGRAMERFGFEVAYTDKEHTFDDVRATGADLYLICTPEGVAPSVVHGLSRVSGAIVIRSSVAPGTTAGLACELGRPIWHNPEFLREAVAESDFLHAGRAIVGSAVPTRISPPTHISPYQVCWALESVYQRMQVPVYRCSSTESEMVKLLTNVYLSVLISTWNDFKVLCDYFGVNSHSVARLVALDSRVSSYGSYQHGRAYGGRCLPKDMDALLVLAQQVGLSVPTISGASATNIFLGGVR